MALPDEKYNGDAKDAPKGDRGNDTADIAELREFVHGYQEVMQETFEEGEEDIDFLDGEQWPDEAEAERDQDDRPMMTFPKLTQFWDQLCGEEMMQRPSIRVMAADGWTASQQVQTETEKQISLAATYAGLIRQIERMSHARTAYDNAFAGATGWGWGHWRIMTRYMGDSFHQDIIIVPVWDPFAVAWDPNAVELTREDAENCAIRSPFTKKEIERRHGRGAATVSFDWGSIENGIEWCNGDTVYLAEWFKKVPETYTIVLLSDGRVMRADEIEAVKDELAAQGITVKQEREHKGHYVEWRLCSGVEVLEGPIRFPSQYIPVVPVWGRLLYRKGKFRYRGVIRNAKDEQRAYNYARTAAIEAAAQIPKSPYIAAAETIEGYEEIWRTATTKAHAFLPYHAVRAKTGERLPPPTREMGGINLHGLMEMIAISEQGMKSSIGIYDPSLGQKSNEQSGKAIIARQQQGDRLSYPFVANLARAIEHTGRILVDMIPRVYTDESIRRILHDDETEDTVRINQVVVDRQTGKEVVLNDLTVGRFDIAVDVGPSFLTKRMEAAQAMSEFIQVVPAAGPLLADIVVRNQDWPGADAAAERLKKGLVPPQVLESSEGGDDIPPEVRAQIQAAQEQAMLLQQQLQVVQQEAQKAIAEAEKAGNQAAKLEIENARLKAEAAIHAEQDRLQRMQDALNAQAQAVANDAADQTEKAQQGEQSDGQMKQIAEALAQQAEALAALTQAVMALRGGQTA